MIWTANSMTPSSMTYFLKALTLCHFEVTRTVWTILLLYRIGLQWWNQWELSMTLFVVSWSMIITPAPSLHPNHPGPGLLATRAPPDLQDLLVTSRLPDQDIPPLTETNWVTFELPIPPKLVLPPPRNPDLTPLTDLSRPQPPLTTISHTRTTLFLRPEDNWQIWWTSLEPFSRTTPCPMRWFASWKLVSQAKTSWSLPWRRCMPTPVRNPVVLPKKRILSRTKTTKIFGLSFLASSLITRSTLWNTRSEPASRTPVRIQVRGGSLQRWEEPRKWLQLEVVPFIWSTWRAMRVHHSQLSESHMIDLFSPVLNGGWVKTTATRVNSR